MTLPQNDPSRMTRCTNLQRLMQDKVGKRLATACLTPAYVNGRYIGRLRLVDGADPLLPERA